MTSSRYTNRDEDAIATELLPTVKLPQPHPVLLVLRQALNKLDHLLMRTPKGSP